MTKRLSEEGVDNLFLKVTLHAHADGNELRRHREVRKVLTKLDALDDRLAEIAAVQRGLLKHILAMRLQRQLSDAKTGRLWGTKEDLPPATATAIATTDDAVEIVGFLCLRREAD